MSRVKYLIILPVLLLFVTCRSTTTKPSDINTQRNPTASITSSPFPTEQISTLVPKEITQPCQPIRFPTDVDNRWVPIGPYGGSIRGIVINPLNPDQVYIATYGAGVFVSNNGGDTWQSSSKGLEKTNITSIAMDPNDSSKLYVGTGIEDGAHLYQSNDSGKTWTKVRSDQEWIFNEISSLEFSSKGLLVGSMALYDVNGNTWNQLTEGFLGNGFIQTAIDPNRLSTYYVGTYQGGLFRSDNAGKTWSAVGNKIIKGAIYSIAIKPKESNILLLGVENGLYFSQDRGSTWSKVNQDAIRTIVFDPNRPSIVWTGRDEGLSWSKNGGETWQSVPDFDGIRVESIGLSPDHSEDIYVGTYKQGLFRSRDGGVSWQSINTGISNSQVSVVEVSSNTDPVIYAGTLGDGLFITNDWGKSWSHIEGELKSAYVKSIEVNHAQQDTVYVGTWDGLYYSFDAGKSWKKADSPLDGKQVVSLAIAENEDNTIFAGTQGDGLFASQDEGYSWIKLNSPQQYVTALLVDPENAKRLYIGTLYGIYRTDDMGISWEKVSKGLTDLNVTSLMYGDKHGLLAATTGDGVYLSDDQGKLWKKTTYTLGRDYFRSVLVQDQLVAASWNGVFSLESENNLWNDYSSGLLNRRVTSLAAAESIMLAGTYGGGVNIMHKNCRPVYGLVTNSKTGEPIFAKVTVIPGALVTYTDINGYYSFDSVPSTIKSITAESIINHQSETIEINIENASSLRVDFNLPTSQQGNIWPAEIITPPSLAPIQHGKTTTFVLLAQIPEQEINNSIVVWTSDIEGSLGTSLFNEKCLSQFTVKFRHINLQTITAEIINKDDTKGQASTTIQIKEPGDDSGAIGMAWDGNYLWLSSEPAEHGPGQIGRIYQMVTQNGTLEIVNKFAHPSPAPDSIAWDGESFWTAGYEGPDPTRVWEEGTIYLYKHGPDPELSVLERYRIADGLIHPEGLTWDGQYLWATSNNYIMQLTNLDTKPIAGLRHEAFTNQLRAIEFVSNSIWVFDSNSDKLYKYSIRGSSLSLDGECELGIIGSYGMAWDGSCFWLGTLGSPALSCYSLPTDCPQP